MKFITLIALFVISQSAFSDPSERLVSCKWTWMGKHHSSVAKQGENWFFSELKDKIFESNELTKCKHIPEGWRFDFVSQTPKDSQSEVKVLAKELRAKNAKDHPLVIIESVTTHSFELPVDGIERAIHLADQKITIRLNFVSASGQPIIKE